jgi:hypothetical protein
MSRRAVGAVAFALVALTLLLGGCLGGDDEDTTNSPAPAAAPDGDAAPPSPTGLPPELVECFADRGFDLKSPAEIHSAPPQVVQECFGALHQGGLP